MKIKNLFIAFLFIAKAGVSCAAIEDCDNPAIAKQTALSIDADLDKIRNDQKVLEANLQKQISAEADQLIADGLWKEEDRRSFFSKLIDLPESKAFEDEKKFYLLMFFMHSRFTADSLKNKNYKDACGGSYLMRQQLGPIGKINERQYAFMLQKVRSARTEVKP